MHINSKHDPIGFTKIPAPVRHLQWSPEMFVSTLICCINMKYDLPITVHPKHTKLVYVSLKISTIWLFEAVSNTEGHSLSNIHEVTSKK